MNMKKNMILETLSIRSDATVWNMSEDEYNNTVNAAIAEIEKTLKVYDVDINAENRAKRLDDVKAITEDPTIQLDLASEDNININSQPEKIKAREEENNRYRAKQESANIKTYEQFKKDIEKAAQEIVNDVVEDADRETFSLPNRRKQGQPVVTPAIRHDEVSKGEKPIFDVYFDQSGSWEQSELDRGMAAIQDLVKLKEQSLIELNIYYFANRVHTDAASARQEGGTRAWPKIIENIQAPPKTQNVIIISDRDLDVQGTPNATDDPVIHQVTGMVWWVWKYKSTRCTYAPQKLRGKKSNVQYALY